MEEDWLVKLVRLTIYHNGTIDYKAMSSSFLRRCRRIVGANWSTWVRTAAA